MNNKVCRRLLKNSKIKNFVKWTIDNEDVIVENVKGTFLALGIFGLTIVFAGYLGVPILTFVGGAFGKSGFFNNVEV